MEKIEDYALIGNCRTGALVSKNGSIDWLCLPRFDSPSVFGALLDEKVGGFWIICATNSFETSRCYIDKTNVLQTQFKTPTGLAILTDFMTALSEEEKQKSLQSEHELIRQVSCESGHVDLFIHYNPRPNYGKSDAELRDCGPLGIRFEIQQSLFNLKTDIPLAIGPRGAKANVTLKAGEKITFSFTHTLEGPGIIACLEEVPSKLKSTILWWQNWIKQLKYKGPYLEQVERSALALKLLSYAPSGAFVAAPTTSLPEVIGGEMNWDYRFCWLRDSAFIVKVLFDLGFREEGAAFVGWLLHSTRLSLPKLNILYTVFGGTGGKETTLDHLQGYENSKPVRIGNAAQEQIQLDCYGEVIDSVYTYLQHGGTLNSETKKMIKKLGQYVCKHWQEPDAGIWESREEKKHYTYSKLMCWVALDRLIKMNEKRWISHSLLEKFTRERDQIRHEIETKGWNEELGCYTDTFGGEKLDASLLNLSFYKFERFSSKRMKETFRLIKERLYDEESGVLFRTENSFKDREGAFLMCSFWMPEFYAHTDVKPKKSFEQLLSYANECGLFSEEIDAKSMRFLGNFPQAFTHIALIRAALAIQKEEA